MYSYYLKFVYSIKIYVGPIGHVINAKIKNIN